MKSDTHPQVYDVVFVDTSSGDQFISTSTRKSEETMKIDGKEYYVMKVEISSATHPFFTGKQKLVDSSGRVEKFKAKMEKAQALAAKKVEKVEEGKEKEAAKESTQEKAQTKDENQETEEKTEVADSKEEKAETPSEENTDEKKEEEK